MRNWDEDNQSDILCASLVPWRVGPAPAAEKACHLFSGRRWLCQCLLDRNANLVLRRRGTSPLLIGSIPKRSQRCTAKTRREGRGKGKRKACNIVGLEAINTPATTIAHSWCCTSCRGCTHLGSDHQTSPGRLRHCSGTGAAFWLAGYSGPQDPLSHSPQRRKC